MSHQLTGPCPPLAQWGLPGLMRGVAMCLTIPCGFSGGHCRRATFGCYSLPVERRDESRAEGASPERASPAALFLPAREAEIEAPRGWPCCFAGNGGLTINPDAASLSPVAARDLIRCIPGPLHSMALGEWRNNRDRATHPRSPWHNQELNPNVLTTPLVPDPESQPPWLVN